MKNFLRKYLQERPIFLSLIRAKEAWLWQEYLPFNSPVLDVGCGDGVFAKIAFKKIDVGLDLPDSRITQAKKEKVYGKLVVFDGIKLPFRNRSIKTVISNCVLEHVDRLPQLLAEINRVLVPKGKLLVTVAARPWEDNLLGAYVFGHSYKAWMRRKQMHLNLCNLNGWDSEFKRAGFKVKKRVGYLSPEACRRIDLAHYVSLPSLITYALMKKWVLFPKLNTVVGMLLAGHLEENVDARKSGAIFYDLEKNKDV